MQDKEKVILIVKFTTFFCLLQLACPSILCRLFAKWWDGLREKKRQEIPPNVAALFHHFCVVPVGFYYHYQYFFGDGNTIPTEIICLMSPFICGYFLADSIFYAIPEAYYNKKFEFLFHHVLGIWINVASTGLPSDMHSLRLFASSLIITEISSIFFITGWFIRCSPYSKTALVDYFNIMFAVSFFFTRNVNLTIHTVIVWRDFDIIGTWFKWGAMVPVLLLQFFWLYKILLAAFAPGVTSPRRKEEEYYKKE
jgi:hypothetical protein